MSIGAYILKRIGTGNLFAGLPADLDCAVTEIRIEQHLDRRATFAIRFQEDFEDGEAKTITADDLRGSKEMAILVDGGPGQPDKNALGVAPAGTGQLICLLRGQVENSQAEVNTGGSGSWYEVRGQDVRTLAERACDSYKESGKATEIARALSATFTTGAFNPDSKAEDVLEFTDNFPYQFYGTRLEGLERLSKLCDYPVRLAYNLEQIEADVFRITTDVHFEPSPPRGQDVPAGADLPLTPLEGKTSPWLRIMGSEGACENVINFSLQSDNEGYSSVSTTVVHPNTGEAVIIEDQEATHTVLVTGGEDSKNNGAKDERKLRVTLTGAADMAAAAARSAANAASWYVKANALTTVHMLGKVLQPHDLVEVTGGGCGISGVFQVVKVVHVINAAAHWMHLDLRSNSRSIKPPAEGPLDG